MSHTLQEKPLINMGTRMHFSRSLLDRDVPEDDSSSFLCIPEFGCKPATELPQFPQQADTKKQRWEQD